MTRILTLILLAGAMLAGSANAQTKTQDERWILIGHSTDGETTVYVDRQTIRRDGDTVLLWEKFADRDGKGALGHEQIRRDRQSRSLSFFYYDAKGNSTHSSRTPTEWQEPVPGSMQEMVNDLFDWWVAMTAPKDSPSVRY